MAEIEHPRLTVMFTDIKGYSRMMSEDEATALRVLEEHNAIMESVISAHGGRVFKRLGDAFAAETCRGVVKNAQDCHHAPLCLDIH